MATGSVKDYFLRVDKIDEYYQQTGQCGLSLEFTDGNKLRLLVGKLDASNNYVQFWVNGEDKGYIKFTVSRNV